MSKVTKDSLILGKAVTYAGTFDVKLTKYRVAIHLHYPDIPPKVSESITYLLKSENNSLSFRSGHMFRGGKPRVVDGALWMRDVNWLTTSWRGSPSGIYELWEPNSHLQQDGSISIKTIGDSQSIYDYNHAQHLRRKLNTRIPQLLFNGNCSDKFGYPHGAIGG